MDERVAGEIERARTHQAAGRLEQAVACYRRAARLAPVGVEAVGGLADVLQALGRGAEAVVVLGEAVGKAPDSAALHARLADALQVAGELSGALASYRQAVALDPDLARAWWGLGCACEGRGEHAAAAEAFGRVAALQPDDGRALHNLGKALFELGEVDGALDAFRAALDRLPPEGRGLPLEGIAVAIPGSPSAGPADVLDARRAWAARCLPATPAGARRDAPDADAGRAQPLRVGYVSAFFARRNWMKPVWALINHHDRDRFEVHLFSDGPEAGVVDGYRKDPRDRFHDVAALADADLARLVERLGIDLLVDLNAYSQPARLGVFARRPAPVQAAWFNTFAPTGLTAFDVLIGDRHVVPPGEESLYAERVVRVPGSYLTFEVGYPVPEVAPAPCLERGAITFGCLAPLYKVTPGVVAAWSEVLNGSPGSRLVLKNTALGEAAARDLVRARFGRHGVPADRVDLDGPAEHFTFLERYADVDVALDTFPYNGGTTTMEALWQGVPVLTFAGDRWAARIGASLLREAGLDGFVAPDLAAHVAQAVALANDPATPARLVALRRTMRDRLRRAPVCDARAFARAVEGAYLAMGAGP